MARLLFSRVIVWCPAWRKFGAVYLRALDFLSDARELPDAEVFRKVDVSRKLSSWFRRRTLQLFRARRGQRIRDATPHILQAFRGGPRPLA
jgi:hypothetical protein